LRTLLRTTHLIAAGALYGGHVYSVEAERLIPALVAVLVTGGAFLALEVYQASVWLVQIRGVATLVKLALVAAVGLFWELRVALLTVAVIVGGVSSHMPGRWRYHSVLHGRVVGPRESG
jgi:xanthine/uracil/vitamin C permease (AzgA family)